MRRKGGGGERMGTRGGEVWTGEEGGEKVVMIMGRRGRGEIGRPSSGDKKNPPGRLIPSSSILPLFSSKSSSRETVEIQNADNLELLSSREFLSSLLGRVDGKRDGRYLEIHNPTKILATFW